MLIYDGELSRDDLVVLEPLQFQVALAHGLLCLAAKRRWSNLGHRVTRLDVRFHFCWEEQVVLVGSLLEISLGAGACVSAGRIASPRPPS